jgi:hypothetical protein
MGVEGDLPNDFKFQFGGALFRDTTRNLRAYGLYGSLWVHLPADEPAETYVFPPFQGANGGPTQGPIMTLAGQEIDGFVVPLAVRPGTILEVGDTFSFSAQLAPTLPARLDVVVTGPNRFTQTISGRANAIGYFSSPSQDFAVTAPGVYHATVTATFDSPTSVGPMGAPYPTGSILGAVAGGFDVYVVSPDSSVLTTDLPARSVILGLGPVSLTVQAPNGVEGGTVHFTTAMPGFLLEAGTTQLENGDATITYDPVRLNRTFPNLDLTGRVRREPGLADTVWVSALLEGDDGNFSARQFVLQGPDLFAPPEAAAGVPVHLAGKKLLLKSSLGDPAGLALAALSKDAGIELGGGNFSADDPVISGGSLRVATMAGDGFDATYQLPAAAWSYVGAAGTNKGYKYKDALLAEGPIKLALVMNGKLVKAIGKGSGLTHSLGVDPRPVAVVLTTGVKKYCMGFGGTTTFKTNQLYLAKDAPAPSACPQ